MDATIKKKLERLLWLESKENYDSPASMAEGLLDEFTDEEQAQFCDEIGELVEEWWQSEE